MKKTIHNMELHDVLQIDPHLKVLKVQNGWIYYYLESSGVFVSSVLPVVYSDGDDNDNG